MPENETRLEIVVSKICREMSELRKGEGCSI